VIKKCFLLIIISISPLFAALGSGFFLRGGVGLTGLGGSDLYLLTSELRYRKADPATLMLNHKEFSGSNGLLRPAFTLGWEQSFNMFVSVQAGAGLAFTGLKWNKIEVTNQFNKVDHVVDNDAILKVTYCSIPVELRLMLPINSGGFTFSFGPWFGLLVSAQFDNKARSFKENQYDQFKPFSFGFGGSLGGEIQLKKTDLLIDLRIDGEDTNASKDESLQMHYARLGLEVGIRFTSRRLEKPSWYRL
jgi:hypothetical protein